MHISDLPPNLQQLLQEGKIAELKFSIEDLLRIHIILKSNKPVQEKLHNYRNKSHNIKKFFSKKNYGWRRLLNRIRNYGMKTKCSKNINKNMINLYLYCNSISLPNNLLIIIFAKRSYDSNVE